MKKTISLYIWAMYQVNLEVLQNLISNSVDAAKRNMGSIMYNHNIMHFLFQQMQNFFCIFEGICVHPIFASGDRSWQETCDELEKNLALGVKLIERHSRTFDVHKFYKAENARNGVETICNAMHRFLAGWGQEIDEHVPDYMFDKDQAFLKSCLAFVFGDVNVEFDEEGVQNWVACQQEWETVKAGHERCVLDLEIANDGDVEILNRIARSRFEVFRAKYKGQEAAAKKVGEFGHDSTTGLEDFADFFSEVCVQASLTHDHIAKLMAVTRSGWLIMELASCDLAALCHSGPTLEWEIKLRILQHIASALQYMHSMDPPVLHCDIKSPNILIFG